MALIDEEEEEDIGMFSAGEEEEDIDKASNDVEEEDEDDF